MRDELRRWVLEILRDGEVAGPELRGRLAAGGLRLSPLAFHGLMAGLEAEGVVLGRYEPADLDGAPPGWRSYRAAAVTAEGAIANAA